MENITLNYPTYYSFIDQRDVILDQITILTSNPLDNAGQILLAQYYQSLELLDIQLQTIQQQIDSDWLIVLNTALASLNNLNPSSISAERLKQVNQIWVRLIRDGYSSLTTIEHSTLTSIAGLCPIEGGKASYRARALLLRGDFELTWNDEVLCTPPPPPVQPLNSDIEKINSAIKVFPNPVSENINIEFKSATQVPWTIILSDQS